MDPTLTPHPFDHDPHWQAPTRFDAFQEAFALSAYPAGSGVLDVSSYRPGYMQYPLRVGIALPEGRRENCVLKIGRTAGGVSREAKLLPVLKRLGLPVPSVMAGPVTHPDWPSAGPMVLLSELPGRPLPFVNATLDQLDLTCRLLQEAVGRMRQLTDAVRREGVDIPRMTLIDELQGIMRRGGPWPAVPLYARAVDRLLPVLERIEDPLVLSNGDYNTFNFLTDGASLTGCLDFTGACLEDPHIGFARFTVWGFDAGWQPGVKIALVERYLYAQDVSRSGFAPRLALHCLWRLQREVSVTGPQDLRYRESVLKVLQDALRDINNSGDHP